MYELKVSQRYPDKQTDRNRKTRRQIEKKQINGQRKSQKDGETQRKIEKYRERQHEND